MSSAKNSPAAGAQYAVISIGKTEPPEGAEGSNWYRYVIERGTSTIVGNRSGTLSQVTRHVNDFVEALNSRNGALGVSTWLPRQKKQPSEAAT